MLRRAVACMLLASLSACMMWHPAELTEITPDAVPDRLRVTRTDGTSVVLEYTAVRADSITGVAGDGDAPTTVGFGDVETLERWGFDPGFLFVPVIVTGILLLNYFPLDDGPTGNTNGT